MRHGDRWYTPRLERGQPRHPGFVGADPGVVEYGECRLRLQGPRGVAADQPALVAAVATDPMDAASIGALIGILIQEGSGVALVAAGAQLYAGPIAGAISGASGYVMDGFRSQLEEAAAEAAHGAKLFANAMDEASDDALEMRDELDELLPTLYANTTDLLAEIADGLEDFANAEADAIGLMELFFGLAPRGLVHPKALPEDLTSRAARKVVFQFEAINNKQ